MFVGLKVPAIGWIRALDVFTLLTTTTEHGSNSVLEAMACSRPVIATRVAGSAELLGGAEGGILVPPADPAAVAQAILRIAALADRGAAMGQSARARVETQFAFPEVARRHRDLWHAVARGRR